NKFVDENKPWELVKDSAQRTRLHEICSDILRHFWILTVYLHPILPLTTKRAAQLLGMNETIKWADLERIPESINRFEHLMARVEEKQLDALFDIEKEPIKVTSSTPHPASPAKSGV